MNAVQMPLTSADYVGVEVSAPGFSARANWKCGKRWSKTVDAVDPAERGGYALQGRFLRDGRAMLTVGSIVLGYSDSNEGSGGYPRIVAQVCIERVTERGSLERLTWIEAQRESWAAEAVEFLLSLAQSQTGEA